ncbi:MAG: hypothetical protein LQ352_006936, partial [Teloschistes flavicans]
VNHRRRAKTVPTKVQQPLVKLRLPVQAHDECFGRKFDPDRIWGPDAEIHSKLREGNRDLYASGFIHVPCPQNINRRHSDSIIVSTGAMYRANALPGDAQSAYGVYFSFFSPYNFNGTIAELVDSSQTAELHACVQALTKIQLLQTARNKGIRVIAYPERMTQIIVKADSEYLVRGMTEHIDKWKKNGYKNSKGKQLKNVDLFQLIEQKIESLAQEGAAVSFWHVTCPHNREAHALANAALDGRIQPAIKGF